MFVRNGGKQDAQRSSHTVIPSVTRLSSNPAPQSAVYPASGVDFQIIGLLQPLYHPPAMIAAVTRMLDGFKVPKSRIAFDGF
jgi:hypothetical protein